MLWSIFFVHYLWAAGHKCVLNRFFLVSCFIFIPLNINGKVNQNTDLFLQQIFHTREKFKYQQNLKIKNDLSEVKGKHWSAVLNMNGYRLITWYSDNVLLNGTRKVLVPLLNLLQKKRRLPNRPNYKCHLLHFM